MEEARGWDRRGWTEGEAAYLWAGFVSLTGLPLSLKSTLGPLQKTLVWA